MTTTAMKRAGLLALHLDTLHQISDVRQLLLLQLSMRERQDQVALFKRQQDTVTLSLIGAQLAAPTEELNHRAGTAPAAALLNQLQQISGIRGNDVAFSGGQIAEMIAAQTHSIEISEGLAKLDAALLSLVGKLEQEAGEAQSAATPDEAPLAGASAEQVVEVPSPEEAALEDQQATDEEGVAEADSGLSAGRPSRRRSA